MKKTLLYVLAVLLSPATWADDINVAVAANFTAPMQKIATQFQQKTGHRVLLSSGATGKFYAQIKNDAPFDVLFSADQQTPERLEREGSAVSNTRFTYAIGQLVLWSPRAGLIDNRGAVLSAGHYTHLAIANPKLAPYGNAAQQVLTRFGLLDNIRPKLVVGENIGQAYQFVQTGNADMGFVARSQVQNEAGQISGSYWLVPSSMYTPIIQQAIVLNPGRTKPAVGQLMQYLKGAAAREIIKKYGYGLAQ